MFHDTLFKQLLQSDFPAFIRLFFPDVAANVDFHRLEWLDKEHFTDLPNGAQRRSDLVAKAASLSTAPDSPGVSFLFLTELEARQGQQAAGFSLEERLFQYYSILWNRYRLPIYPVVIYIVVSSGGLQRHTHQHCLFGMPVMELHFRSVGLPKLPAQEFLGKGPALQAALAASMSPGPWSRAELKVHCLDALARADGNNAQKFIAVNHIETYLKLNDLENAQFEQILQEKTHMDAQEVHLTWADEMMLKGEARGEARGELNGQRRTLARLLARKFGTLSPKILARLDSISKPERLDELTELVLTATSLKELGLE